MEFLGHPLLGIRQTAWALGSGEVQEFDIGLAHGALLRRRDAGNGEERYSIVIDDDEVFVANPLMVSSLVCFWNSTNDGGKDSRIALILEGGWLDMDADELMLYLSQGPESLPEMELAVDVSICSSCEKGWATITLDPWAVYPGESRQAAESRANALGGFLARVVRLSSWRRDPRMELLERRPLAASAQEMNDDAEAAYEDDDGWKVAALAECEMYDYGARPYGPEVTPAFLP